MLRIVHVGNTTPYSLICDPSASFQPGMICQLCVIGNQIMGTVSNGTAPYGIIDDIKTRAFTNVSWNEVIIVPATGVLSSGKLVTPIDLKAELEHANIQDGSFTSSVAVTLNKNNGVITFISGTELNFDLTGSGSPNAIRAVVNYTYYVPNIPGDDSTLGSGRMTVWYQKMLFQTDQYETNQSYPLNANLYVNEVGLLTSRQPSPSHASIAILTAPPNALMPFIEVMWL